MSNSIAGQDVSIEEFENYRPLLFAIAYRMLGSASEAEDIVQETYLRYRTSSESDIRSLKTYLSTIATHLCLDYLKSAHTQREQYIGTWLPEPVLTNDPAIAPLETIEQSESISLAFLVLLQSLTPPERAVFLLHEVFDYDYQEIASIIGKSTANCRQLLHRAKAEIAERRQRFEPSREEYLERIERFSKACQEGDVQGLADILAQDVITWSDGGGKVPAALRPIYGIQAVTRLWLSLTRKAPTDLLITLEEVNGSPGVVLWAGGALYAVITFEIVDGQIRGIYAVVSPDKLAYVALQLGVHPLGPTQSK
jgi:RNA polymerase sigma-70 factor (ECF subfamily)